MENDTKTAGKDPEIIIVGGGFGGVSTARSILALIPNARITLISAVGYLEYYPGFFRMFEYVPVESLRLPLIDIVPNEVTLLEARVAKVDAFSRTVTLETGEVRGADFLVISPGSTAFYFNISGLEETTWTLRSTEDAVLLQDHIFQLFQKHAKSSRDEQVVAFRFVVVGGGPTGVELAAEIASHVRSYAKEFSVCETLPSIDLIESKERVLSAMSWRSSRFAHSRLRKLGVHLMCNRTLIANHSWSIELGDAQLGARTVVWAAGVQSSPLVKQVPGFKYDMKGRVEVNQFLEATPGVYVIGDVSTAPGSGLAQGALAHGKFVAEDIYKSVRMLRRRYFFAPRFFHVVPIGHGFAVAELFGISLSGYVPWLLRGLIDLWFYVQYLGLSKGWVLFFGKGKSREAKI